MQLVAFVGYKCKMGIICVETLFCQVMILSKGSLFFFGCVTFLGSLLREKVLNNLFLALVILFP